MDPKKYGPNFIWTQIFWSWLKNIFDPIFFNPLLAKTFSIQNSSWLKTFFPNSICIQNLSDPIFLNLQSFFSEIFLDQKFLGLEFFLEQKISGPKIFWTKHFFQLEFFCTQHFFCLELNFILSKFLFGQIKKENTFLILNFFDKICGGSKVFFYQIINQQCSWPKNILSSSFFRSKIIFW